jgi:hypothetical protein
MCIPHPASSSKGALHGSICLRPSACTQDPSSRPAPATRLHFFGFAEHVSACVHICICACLCVWLHASAPVRVCGVRVGCMCGCVHVCSWWKRKRDREKQRGIGEFIKNTKSGALLLDMHAILCAGLDHPKVELIGVALLRFAMKNLHNITRHIPNHKMRGRL